VGRFERDENHLPQTLGVATESLRTTIEEEVARIVQSAEARATEIEDRALEKASRIEQVAERRVDEAFGESRERLAQMLSEIDAVEQILGQAVRSLRTDAERLTAGLTTAAGEPFAEDPDVDNTEAEFSAMATSAGANLEAANIGAPDPAVRDLIRQQLQSFAESGRTREDAERMLRRFQHGDQYFDLLDEIYAEGREGASGRRGLLRRRKAEE
jgi:replicative DNA helicase